MGEFTTDSVHVHIMILLEYGLLYFLLSAGILAEKNSNQASDAADNAVDNNVENVVDDAKDRIKDEAKDKAAQVLKCFSCVEDVLKNPTGNCVNPGKDTQFIKCDKKCFSYLWTKTSQSTGDLVSKTIFRGCTTLFPENIEDDVRKRFQNNTITEFCRQSTEVFDGLKANLTITKCGSVCNDKTEICNNDMPGESGLSTGAIIGIVCGSVFGLALIIGIVVFIMKKKDYK